MRVFIKSTHNIVSRAATSTGKGAKMEMTQTKEIERQNSVTATSKIYTNPSVKENQSCMQKSTGNKYALRLRFSQLVEGAFRGAGVQA
jgi:hypothetical protein